MWTPPQPRWGGSTARCHIRDHRMAAGIIASAGGEGRADSFGRCRCGHGHGRRREGEGAAATEEATGRPRVFSPPRTSARGRPWGTASLTRPSGGVEAEAAALEEATGRPRETSPQRTRLRERPWVMSSQFAAGGRASVICRCECGHEMVAGIIASTDKSARTAAEDAAINEGRGGRLWQLALMRPREDCEDHRLCRQVRANGCGGCCLERGCQGERKRRATATDETMELSRGNVSSVDEGARTIVWRTVTDEATAGKGSVGRRFRRSHRTTAVAIASAKKSCGRRGRCCHGRRRVEKGERKRRPPPQTRSQDCRRVCRFCGKGLVRRREGSGDLPS